MESRKQRKLEAKQNGTPFVPQYNGNGVLSYEEYYSVGNERFNNKFVQFLKPLEAPHELSDGVLISKEEVKSETESITKVEIIDTQDIEVVETELVKDVSNSLKDKVKKKFKKLFNK
ncbi:hypothetical protein QH639_02565 [Lysinibacillus sp. 1 U-2021]|uniref:hypothetical protein n=1 Tax=Lysinibacillus sp. 1 U-2021 TaxID=3039426 RepID=UPI002481424E|nr:hypothetical protein [Lysinibacillus sp. 1 U-2021]WGT39700.1 hypothetical protein QH639_02565 [Lysinibacillus sp. 1 U-2021]